MRFVFVIIRQSSGEDKITVLLNMVASWSVYRRLFRLKKKKRKKKTTTLSMIYVLQMFSVIYRGNHNHESSRAPGCDRWREHCAALPGFTRSDSRSEVHLVLQWAGHPLWKSRGLLWKSRWGESMCASLHSLVWVSSVQTTFARTVDNLTLCCCICQCKVLTADPSSPVSRGLAERVHSHRWL